eukprot:CAMPEP_0195526724 /NCGR_PEP_ID=MMETSP0794_2-20130614/27965_1 /TAXON_ID=515487 /ORGANISM="Stephanopyxis turris, Strain CCMP 815" /LENGTH=63 /DNA_ID=CAMNT_0040657481 /DNA_START=80 /DNA_END=268 /DNA_ORIENTATION=-
MALSFSENNSSGYTGSRKLEICGALVGAAALRMVGVGGDELFVDVVGLELLLVDEDPAPAAIE